MELMVIHTKNKLAEKRSKVTDDILEEYPSCNSDQVEEEANRRMLNDYLDQFVRTFQNMIIFFYQIKTSDIYKAIIDLKDEAMVAWEDEHEMTNDKELELLLKTIADNKEMYEDLFID